MSRCFPYPPPGYVRNHPHGVGIASIERQKDIERSKFEKKKEKKERKKLRDERRKDRKEKKETKLCAESKNEFLKLKHDSQCEKVEYDLKGVCILKAEKELDAEQLERSSVTEEHGQPVYSHSACYLSDGTQSSNKRKAEVSDESNGNIVRIKLTIRKHEETTSTSGDRTWYSPSGIVDHRVQFCNSTNQKMASQEEQGCSVLDEQALSFSSRDIINDKKLPKADRKYRDLFVNWCAPPIQLEQRNSNSQDWLFGTNQKDVHSSKKLATCKDDVRQERSGSLFPFAHYLPEADMFALPYAIPF